MADHPSFVGRTSELNLLDELYASSKSEFLVLYGRRRVGKTRLLTEWLTTRKIKPIFFVSEQDSKGIVTTPVFADRLQKGVSILAHTRHIFVCKLGSGLEPDWRACQTGKISRIH